MMTPFVTFFLSYILLYKYIALFLIVFIAGLEVPLPVNVLLLAVGAFASQGYFNFNISLIVVLISNTIADILVYLFFIRYGHNILRDKYAEKYSFFVRLEEFFNKYCGTSIFISRIIGVFGLPVNFLAGYNKVSFKKFMIFDVSGNIAFALIFLSLGYWAGDEWVNVSGFIDILFAIWAVLIVLLIVWGIYKKRKH